MTKYSNIPSDDLIPKDGDALRTFETLVRYRDNANPNFMDEVTFYPVGEPWSKYWGLIVNEFPYDKIAERHDLLVPLRKFAEADEMNAEELADLNRLHKEFAKDYDAILMNLPHSRSVPGYFHFHLIKFQYRIPPIRT